MHEKKETGNNQQFYYCLDWNFPVSLYCYDKYSKTVQIMDYEENIENVMEQSLFPYEPCSSVFNWVAYIFIEDDRSKNKWKNETDSVVIQHEASCSDYIAKLSKSVIFAPIVAFFSNEKFLHE